MADKCKGCQSFCMRGAQCAGQAPGKSTDTSYSSSAEQKKGTYPSGWTSWKDIAQDKSLCDFLTSVNHNDLITYIIDTYNEGKFNCSNISDTIKELTEKSGGLSIISDTVTSIESVSGFNNGNFEVNKDTVIEASHYNNFSAPLGLNSNGTTAAITEDPKGESISQTNDNGPGPIAGWPGESTAIVTSHNPTNKVHQNSEIITASLYKDLYNAASKLKYHPYQCNICNIYEGGQWHEIVKQTADSIGYTIPYNQGGFSASASVSNVKIINIRQDCSGYVSACLDIFSMIEAGEHNGTRVCSNGSSDNFRDGHFPSSCSNVKQYFNFSSSIGTPEPGSIIVMPRPDLLSSGHVEIVKEDGIGSYSGGGGSGGVMMKNKSIWDHRCSQKWAYLGGGGGNNVLDSNESQSDGSGNGAMSGTTPALPWYDQRPDWMDNGSKKDQILNNNNNNNNSVDKVLKSLTIPSQYGTWETYEKEIWSTSDKYHGWSKGTPQRQLRINAIDSSRMRKGDIFGLRNCAIIDDRLLIATRPNIGNQFSVSIGDYLNVYFSDGSMWKCILGDIKGADANHSWGHDNGKSVVEIIYWDYSFNSGNQFKKVERIDHVGSFYG